MSRFGVTPNMCPGCNQPPYPAGFSCQRCGFVGEAEDSVERARRQIFRGALWGMAVLFAIFVVFIGGLLIALG